MGIPITGVLAAQQAKKKKRGTATMTIEPRDAEPEDKLETPPDTRKRLVMPPVQDVLKRSRRISRA